MLLREQIKNYILNKPTIKNEDEMKTFHPNKIQDSLLPVDHTK